MALSNMMLKFILLLESNLGTKAKAELEMLRSAEQTAIDSTKALDRSVAGATQGLGRMAAMAEKNASSVIRQTQYLKTLAKGYDQLAAKMKAVKELGGSAAAAAGGLAAGGLATAAIVKKPVDYDVALRYSANTVFADRDVAGRKAGVSELDGLIKDVVRQFGGNRNQALEGLNKLIGSGQFNFDEAKALLPTLQKTAVASGSSIVELSEMSEKIKIGTGLKGKDLELAIAKVMRAGELGGFEIKDSAKHIAKLVPDMKNMGYTGMDAIDQLATMLQQVRSTAGTNDEAANNLKNLLSKATSDGTKKEFKKQGIDLNKEVALGIARGESYLDVYMRQLEKVAMKEDPTGKAKQAIKEAANTKDPQERKARFDEISEMYRGAGLAKIMGDLQEIAGFRGLDGTKQYGKETLAELKKEMGGTVNKAYEVIDDSASSKLARVGNEADIAQSQALKLINTPLKGFADGVTGLAQEFPKVTTAATLAAAAMTVLAASSGALAAIDLLRRAKTGQALPPGAPGGLPASAAPKPANGRHAGYDSFGPKIADAYHQPTVPTTASTTAPSRLGNLAKMGAIGGAATLAFATVDTVQINGDANLSQADKDAQTGRTIGGATGALGGMAAGAALGSVIPVAGTAIGAVVGMVAGGLLSSKGADALGPGIASMLAKRRERIGGDGGDAMDYSDAMTGMMGGTPSLLTSPAYLTANNGGTANTSGMGAQALEAFVKQPTKVELQPGRITIDIKAPEGFAASARGSMPGFNLDMGATMPGGA